MRKARRLPLVTWIAVAAVLLLPISEIAVAQPASVLTFTDGPELMRYAEPGQLVDIGGRHINLNCIGAGAPTVILMAGLSSWSPVWYRTQPQIAQMARVCTFDRAAYGFSDPAPQPQILSDVVDDLHAALKAGFIPGPYVLLGHSLGGIEARLYAQRWPEDVVGMILDDTSPAAEGLINETIPDFDEVIGREKYASGSLHCALLAARGRLEPSMPEFKKCVFELPSNTPAAFKNSWPRFFTVDYFADRVSLMSSIYTHRYDSVDHRSLGAMPLIVLSAENSWGTWNASTPAIVRFNRSYLKVWIDMHEALAHLSSRGVHRIIKGSGHEIQLDNPQVIIDAVDEVLRQIHAGSKS